MLRLVPVPACDPIAAIWYGPDLAFLTTIRSLWGAKKGLSARASGALDTSAPHLVSDTRQRPTAVSANGSPATTLTAGEWP